MKKPIPLFDETISQAAAEWVLRHDRGLSAPEQDAFSRWMAEDPRHREAFGLHRWGWDEMDRLIGIQTTLFAAPDPGLLKEPRKRGKPVVLWTVPIALAAAASLAVIFFRAEGNRVSERPVVRAIVPEIESRTLDDGSVVELNRGSEIGVQFTPSERRVRLIKGEAGFHVAKNRERPFIVSAGGVDVRAVGTAFNVRFDSRSVEVVVTEGHVRVDRPSASAAGGVPALESDLHAGQSTLIQLAPASANAGI